MILPHELVSKFVVPYIRGAVAVVLFQRGLSQLKISKLLGISQPMVSRYINEGLELQLLKLEELGIPRDELYSVIKVLAEVLMRNRKQDFLRILSSYMNTLLKQGYLCRIHRKLIPDIIEECDLCSKIFGIASDPYIDEIRNAFEILKAHPKAYELVPEVGMNIVVAIPNANTIKDIVGYSGRILRVQRSIVAVGEPMYGGSRHTATILLFVKKRWNEIRAAIVIKLLDKCLKVFQDMKLNMIHVGPHKNPKDLYIDIKLAIERSQQIIDVLIDLGGKGLEPVVYIFGKSAIDLAKMALKCLD